MKFTVDKIEEGILTLVGDEKAISVSCEICPEAKEGDIINIEILKEETKLKKEEVENRLSALFGEN